MGKLFEGLSKTGVEQGGNTAFFDTPAAATIDMAKKLPAVQPMPVQPEVALMSDGTGGASPQTTGASVFGDSPVSDAPRPKLVQPSFSDGALTMAPSLTTKGKILSTILNGAMGFAAGTGARTGGEGFARGMNANLTLRNQRREEANDELNRQYRQAQINNLPIQRALLNSELERNQANTEYLKAGADRRDYFKTDRGLMRIGPYGAGEIVAGTEPVEKPNNTPEYRQQFVDDHPEIFSNPKDPKTVAWVQTGKLDQKSADDVYNMTGPEIALHAEFDPDPEKRAKFARAAERLRPNYAGQNQADKETRDQTREGVATGLAGKALTAAGGDHMAAIRKLDEFAAKGNISAQDRAHIATAKKQLQEQYRTSKVGAKSGFDPATLLQGILQPGSATAQ